MTWTGIAKKVQDAGNRVLGDPITYRRAGFADLNFNSVYTPEAEMPDVDGVGYTTVAPALFLQISQIDVLTPTIPVVGDEVELVDRSLTFNVVEIHYDGEGEALLKLREVRV
jgi:hypothetical protein